MMTSDTIPGVAILGQFRKYDHLERVAHPDVADLAFGTVHVYPKIDGTNASIWASDLPSEDEGGKTGLEVLCGSRRRVLSADADNAGFHAWVHSDDRRALALRMFALQNPHLVIYGEWLVPHSLKTYADDAWRRFYVFDIYTHLKGRYLPYGSYADSLEMMGIDVINPLAVIENPSDNELNVLRDERNTFLVREGVGEGIILKNYDWTNKHGLQPWIKMVRETFATTGRPVVKAGERQIEHEIVEDFLSDAFIEKTWAKVVTAVANDRNVVLAPDNALTLDKNEAMRATFIEEYRYKLIPRFLGTIYWDFIEEETRNFVKKFKSPVVDFSKLQKLIILAAKRTMKEIF